MDNVWFTAALWLGLAPDASLIRNPPAAQIAGVALSTISMAEE